MQDSTINVDANLQQYLASGRRLSFDPKQIKILIVDDEMVSRMVLKRLLEKSGYSDITSVESALAALQLMEHQKEPFHLIMSDVKMPGMNGLEFLCELQKNERFSGIPVIMVSALDELQIVYLCLQNGACDFLVKPVKQGVVQNLWQNVWRKRREQKLMKIYKAEKDKLKSEEDLKNEIDSLQNQVSEAVTTPLKAISSALTKLLADGYLTESVRETLADILRQMQTSQVYKPAVESFILKQNLDDQTKKWFEKEFAVPSVNSLNTTSTSSTTVSDVQIATNSSNSTPSLSRSPSALLDEPFSTDPTLRSALSDRIKNWEFNVWEISDEETMFLMIHIMFSEPPLSLLTRYKISDIQFREFLMDVRKLYHDKNPYHNFRHAFDVTHMVFLLLVRAKAMDYVEPLEIFTLLLCGLLHDVDHPGLNNAFQSATESSLAVIYNDQSILENHHCSSGFTLLKEHQMLNGLTNKEKIRLRKLMIDLILSTDLSRHMKTVTDFEALIESTRNTPAGMPSSPNGSSSSGGNSGEGVGLQVTNEEHRTMMSRVILKAADLSNPSKPFPVAKYWAEVIQEEFFLQGDQEKLIGLPISPFMERGNSSLPQMQVNFSGFIVIPLFQALAKVLPEIQKVVLPVLLENRMQWNGLLKAAEMAKTMFQQ